MCPNINYTPVGPYTQFIASKLRHRRIQKQMLPLWSKCTQEQSIAKSKAVTNLLIFPSLSLESLYLSWTFPRRYHARVTVTMVSRESTKSRRRSRGQRRLENEFTIYLRISQCSRVILFITVDRNTAINLKRKLKKTSRCSSSSPDYGEPLRKS